VLEIGVLDGRHQRVAGTERRAERGEVPAQGRVSRGPVAQEVVTALQIDRQPREPVAAPGSVRRGGDLGREILEGGRSRHGPGEHRDAPSRGPVDQVVDRGPVRPVQLAKLAVGRPQLQRANAGRRSLPDDRGRVQPLEGIGIVGYRRKREPQRLSGERRDRCMRRRGGHAYREPGPGPSGDRDRIEVTRSRPDGRVVER